MNAQDYSPVKAPLLEERFRSNSGTLDRPWVLIGFQPVVGHGPDHANSFSTKVHGWTCWVLHYERDASSLCIRRLLLYSWIPDEYEIYCTPGVGLSVGDSPAHRSLVRLFCKLISDGIQTPPHLFKKLDHQLVMHGRIFAHLPCRYTSLSLVRRRYVRFQRFSVT